MLFRSRLAFEELVQQILQPLLGKTPVNVTLEYAPSDEQATVTVSYDGGRFDPAEGENELSYMLLTKTVEELNYTFDPQRGSSNTISVLIREKAGT